MCVYDRPQGQVAEGAISQDAVTHRRYHACCGRPFVGRGGEGGEAFCSQCAFQIPPYGELFWAMAQDEKKTMITPQVKSRYCARLKRKKEKVTYIFLSPILSK